MTSHTAVVGLLCCRLQQDQVRQVFCEWQPQLVGRVCVVPREQLALGACAAAEAVRAVRTQTAEAEHGSEHPARARPRPLLLRRLPHRVQGHR